MFVSRENIDGTWQNFERLVCRYLSYRGFDGPRVVGTTGDKGADIIAHQNGKRWIFQIKHWKKPVGRADIIKTVDALSFYDAKIPVVVSRSGFEDSARRKRDEYVASNVLVQLWDSHLLITSAEKIEPDSYPPNSEVERQTRPYQETAIQRLKEQFHTGSARKAMIVMATGLGKTRVMCEFIRRVNVDQKLKILVIAHTNDLVYQLERAFWPFMRAKQNSLIWNGLEKQTSDTLSNANFVFACLNTVANYVKSGGALPDFDIVFVDECHHVGDEGMYQEIISDMFAGTQGGAFLVGVTATPWRPDEHDLKKTFGEILLSMDLVAGLREGFLCNIDYRMHTTNFDWSKFSRGQVKVGKEKISPKGINRTLFISEWDDGVIDEFQKVWADQVTPRAIIFCGSIFHAQMMRDKINARQFCRAEAVFSAKKEKSEKQAIHERNRIISDFHVGKVDVICCVDIFNEGIDVPDVNIVVFQRVTHSRRIFIQQLGRGLRVAEGKEKVIVLDFVSDVRRFAAGLELQSAIRGMPVRLNHKMEFYRYGEIDKRAESFLREWLHDIATIEEMGENTADLKYPPSVY